MSTSPGPRSSRAAAILYALLADGDSATACSPRRSRRSGASGSARTSYFDRILGKEEDGRYRSLAREVGRAREPELLLVLPVPGALRRLLLAPVRVHRARPERRLRPLAWIGIAVWAVGNAGTIVVRPPARAVAREPGEHGEDRARRPLELVAPPELLLRVGQLVRHRPRRDDRAVGWIAWIVPAGLLVLLFRVTGIPATERAGAPLARGLRGVPADDERLRPAAAARLVRA